MNDIITESHNSIFLGTKVMIHYNLLRTTFSVLKHDNKVIMYADFVKLGDVEFKVRKNPMIIQGFAFGKLLGYCEYPCGNIPNPPSNNIITYNPHKHQTFIYKESGEPVYTAKEVDIINSTNKIFVVK